MGLTGRLLRSLRRTDNTTTSKQDASAPRPTLQDIFLRNTRGDIHKWHHYFPIYERFLAPLRDEPVTLLEIGTGAGGSLRMWREYFGPSARIYGAELDPRHASYAPPDMRVFVGDQGNPEFLRSIKEEIGEIDIVIDDGGHMMAQQIITFEQLYPVTRRLFLVEDTHTSYWPRFFDMGETTFVEFAKSKVDALYEWHRDMETSARRHGVPPADRSDRDEVSEFCAMTLGVYFFDSIVVFEKGRNEPRWHERR